MSAPSLDRRQFLACTTAAGAAVALTGLSATPGSATVGIACSTTVQENVARLTVKNKAEIRALQLTDIHFFCKPMLPKLDQQTQEDLPRLAELTRPDILLVTGDLWHENPEGKGAEYMRFGVEQIEKLGVPWLFLWGNHDVLDDFVAGHDYIANAKNSLYRGGIASGNYRVDLVDTEGNVLWELLCLNSSERGVMDKPREWLTALRDSRAAEARPPALCLVHIPFKQYEEIWTENKATGIKLEDIAYWDEDGATLPLLKEAADVKAAFCGHDHVNDYSGNLDGVELAYGHATGTGGYGDNALPKGAKLITLNAEAKTYTWETVFPSGERWKPTPDMRITDVEEVPWDVPSKRSRKRDA